MGRSQESGGLESFLLLFTGGLLILFILPGVIAVHAGSLALGFALDCGQLWTFGATASASGIGVLWLVRGPIFALSWYAGACLFSTWVVAFAHWGLHARWPLELVIKAVPGLGG